MTTIEIVKNYLMIAGTIISIIVGLEVIYVVAFKGAKKNIEQDHEIKNLKDKQKKHEEQDTKRYEETKTWRNASDDKTNKIQNELGKQGTRLTGIETSITRLLNRKD